MLLDLDLHVVGTDDLRSPAEKVDRLLGALTHDRFLASTCLSSRRDPPDIRTSVLRVH